MADQTIRFKFSAVGLADVTGGLERIGAGMKNLGGQLGTVGAATAKFGASMSSAGSALLPVSVAMTAIGVASIKMATDLNKGMANVATLIPQSTERVKELKTTVQEMAVRFGKSTNDLTGGLYQVISAFQDTADTEKILELNAKAATAGLSTTTDAINLTSAVTKGYGEANAAAVQKASDLAFVTVKLGQTTFPELAASMGGVIPMAAAMKVKQEELFAAFATLTGVTGNAAEASTQLRQALAGLMKPSEGMQVALHNLGYASGSALVAQEGLVAGIQHLIKSVGGSVEETGKLFINIRAMPAVLAVANGQAGAFAQKLEAMQHAAGATEEAFRAQTEGINKAGHEWEQFKIRIEVAAQRLGDQLIPILVHVGKSLEPLLGYLEKAIASFGKMPGPIQTVVVGLGAMVAGAAPLLLVIGKLSEGVAVFSKMGSSMLSLQAATASASAAQRDWSGVILRANAATDGAGMSLGKLAGRAGLIAGVGIAAAVTTTELVRLGDSLRGIQRQKVDIGILDALKEAPSLIVSITSSLSPLKAAFLDAFSPILSGIKGLATMFSYVQDISDSIARWAVGGPTGSQAQFAQGFTSQQSATIAKAQAMRAQAAAQQSAWAAKVNATMGWGYTTPASTTGPTGAVGPSDEQVKASAEIDEQRKALEELEKVRAKAIEGIAGEIAAIDVSVKQRISDAQASGIQGSALDKLSATYREIGVEQKKAAIDKALKDAKVPALEFSDTLDDMSKNGQGAVDVLGGLNTVIVPNTIGQFKTMSTTTEQWGQMTKQLADTLSLVGVATDSAAGKLIGGIGGGISALGSFQNAFKTTVDKEGNIIKQSFGTKMMAGLNLAGAAIGIGKSLFGAVKGIFSKPEWKKVGEEGARDFGVNFSQQLSQSIADTAESLDIGRFEASLLHISDIATESGKPISSMMDRVRDLMNATANGSVPATQGIEELGKAFASLATEGGQSMVEMIQRTRELGLEVPQIKQHVADALSSAAEGTQALISGIPLISQEDATSQAMILSSVFWAKVKEDGALAAAQAMKPAWDALQKGLADTGLSADAVLGPMRGLMDMLGNEKLAPIVTGLGGIQQAMKGLGDAGYMTTGAFGGFQQQIKSAFDQLVAGGTDSQTALQAVAGALGQAKSTAEQYGLQLDDNTLAMLNQAQAAGVSFPTDPMLQVVDVLKIIAKQLGADVPEALGSTANAFGAAGAEMTGAMQSASGSVESSAASMSDSMSNAAYQMSGAMGEATTAMSTSMSTLPGSAESTFSQIQSITSSAMSGAVGIVASSADQMSGAWPMVADNAARAMTAISSAAQSASWSVATAVGSMNNLHVNIGASMPSGSDFLSGSVPRMAEGGIITKPTYLVSQEGRLVGMVAEKGPEAVGPLAGSGRGGMSVQLNVDARGASDPLATEAAVRRAGDAFFQRIMGNQNGLADALGKRLSTGQRQ